MVCTVSAANLAADLLVLLADQALEDLPDHRKMRLMPSEPGSNRRGNSSPHSNVVRAASRGRVCGAYIRPREPPRQPGPHAGARPRLPVAASVARAKTIVVTGTIVRSVASRDARLHRPIRGRISSVRRPRRSQGSSGFRCTEGQPAGTPPPVSSSSGPSRPVPRAAPYL
jgi:hypothetical protein